MTGKYGNWTAPFAKWVKKSWEDHSKAIGAKEVADRLRKDILAKAREKPTKKG